MCAVKNCQRSAFCFFFVSLRFFKFKTSSYFTRSAAMASRRPIALRRRCKMRNRRPRKKREGKEEKEGYRAPVSTFVSFTILYQRDRCPFSPVPGRVIGDRRARSGSGGARVGGARSIYQTRWELSRLMKNVADERAAENVIYDAGVSFGFFITPAVAAAAGTNRAPTSIRRRLDE